GMAKKKKVVLIIEDDPIQLHALATTLRKEGYAVHTAENGRDGFETAKAKTPDVILLDIIMPVMDGIAALEKINNDPVTKHIPVIILTNFALYEEVHPFMNHDKDHFLTKTNTSLRDIITKVNAILS
ncbi:MAG: response regulator, partial [Patescibacteria group bacterium]